MVRTLGFLSPNIVVRLAFVGVVIFVLAPWAEPWMPWWLLCPIIGLGIHEGMNRLDRILTPERGQK